MSSGPLTSHVLDTVLGRPAQHLTILLSKKDADGTWSNVAMRATNADGRCGDLVSREEFVRNIYKLRFETGEYYRRLGKSTFYPYVEIVFEVIDPEVHHHIPLILSPHGYNTYRGS